MKCWRCGGDLMPYGYDSNGRQLLMCTCCGSIFVMTLDLQRI